MRIALVIERFEPGGGAENAAWQVAHGLARAGEDVTVVTRRAADSSRVEIHRVSVSSAWQPLRVASFSRAAARAAPRGEFDVVYSFSRTRHQDVYRVGAGSHRDYLDRRAGPWRRFTPRHATLLGIERAIFRDPTQILQCSSEMVRREIQERYQIPASRLALVRNGVDSRRFHPSRRNSEGASLRAARGTGEDLVWLFVGSGFERKGLRCALEALALSRVSRTRLWVAGRDSTRRWQRLAQNLGIAGRVDFLGFRRDLAPIYAAADALLLPTRYDACANACLEAAASGLPVLTSAANGAAELLQEGGAVVQDPEDARSFADALDDLEDPAERARAGATARAVAETLGWNEHVEALRKLFASLAR